MKLSSKRKLGIVSIVTLLMISVIWGANVYRRSNDFVARAHELDQASTSNSMLDAESRLDTKDSEERLETTDKDIITTREYTETVTIEYKVEIVEESSIYENESYTKQSGSNGSKDVTYLETSTNGEVTDTEIISESIKVNPVTKIYVKGTKVKQPLVEKVNVSAGNKAEGSYDEALAKAMHHAINLERRSQGLAPISWSNQLYTAAKTRAQEISIRFEHVRPDGSSWDSVNPDIVYAENLATKAYSVESAMRALMKSETHKENILSPFPKGASAIYKLDDNHWYWVQLYGY
ncbi:MAG: G5 domain-containing protein [Erysipelothrix sp.]